LNKLVREQGELERLIGVYNDITKQFDQMSTHRTGEEASNVQNRPVGSEDKDKTTVYSMQYSSGMVNNLLELGSKMADPEFRKQLLNEKIALAIELQKVKTEIEIFSNVVIDSSNHMPKEDMNNYIKKAALDMDNVREAISNIIGQLNGYTINSTGSLFFISGKVSKMDGYSLVDPKFKIKVVAGFLVGALLAVSLIFFRKIV
jgi:hypothetical protein